MRTTKKPIVALAAGAFLFSGLLGHTALAQEILDSSANLTSSGGSTAVSVAYTVTETANGSSPTGDTYEYTYVVSNPTSGVLTSLTLGFDVTVGTVASGATVITLPTTTVSGGLGSSVTPAAIGTVLWAFDVPKNGNTGTLEFESDYGYEFEPANAGGTTPGPWASSNGNGQELPVPNVAVPEPAATGLMAFGILLLPLRKIYVKQLER